MIVIPNKTIYVTESDLPLYDRAQELSESNLSATVAHALRVFIQTEEATRNGLKEINIVLGESGTYSKKRFLGLEMGRTQNFDQETKKLTTMIVYKTAKHRFALYTKEISEWDINHMTDMKNKVSDKVFQKLNLNVQMEEATENNLNRYHLDVFDTIEELKIKIPTTLYQVIFSSKDEGYNFLDI